MFDQAGVMAYRSDLIAECERVRAGDAWNPDEVPELPDEIARMDKQLTVLGSEAQHQHPRRTASPTLILILMSAENALTERRSQGSAPPRHSRLMGGPGGD